MPGQPYALKPGHVILIEPYEISVIIAEAVEAVVFDSDPFERSGTPLSEVGARSSHASSGATPRTIQPWVRGDTHFAAFAPASVERGIAFYASDDRCDVSSGQEARNSSESRCFLMS